MIRFSLRAAAGVVLAAMSFAAAAQSPSGASVPVTPDNFPRAESDL